MLPNPLVSIAIVTWNRREDVLKAIESCHIQTYKNIEIVIVDNASEDGTHETLLEKHPEIKVIMTHRNLGCVPARNIAMANCIGDIVFCLDDDATLDEKCIEHMVGDHQENDDVAVVACNIVSPQQKETEGGSQPNRVKHAGKRGNVAIFLGTGFGIKREALNAVGYFPDYFRQGEENYLSMRVLDAGYKIFFDPRAVVYHYWDYNEKGRSSRQILYLNFRHELENIKRLLPLKHAIPIFTYMVMVNLAKRYLRSGYLRYFFPDFIRVLPILLTDYKEPKIKIETFRTFTKEASRFFKKESIDPVGSLAEDK